MKGKERSPVKKRSRALDESRDRGGSYPSSRKTGPGALSAGSSNGSAQSRRSLHSEKRDTRESDGHISSSRSGGGYEYGAAPGTKSHGVADVAAETSRSGSRSDSRPPSNPGSEYKTLKISELGSELNDEEIEDGLFHEFKKFGEVSVKISRENDYRVAFVNFRRPEDARAAKHARGKLVLYDRPLKIETVYLSRRRSRSPANKEPFPPGHRHLHTQRPASPTGVGYRDYRLQQLALGRLPAPPPPPDLRELGRDREGSLFDARNRIPFSDCAIYREEDLISPEDDERANRTLFLGNLDTSLNENDLRRTFERFGVITAVDIKRTTRGQSHTFGFIKFENLDMAHRAKLAMSGKVVGHSPIKIGYGKPTPSTRLWVGGLGPWIPLAALAKEFDRFGTIRTIDYRKGDVWAYIQYESMDAAQAACTHMRGFPLGGPDRRLRVDFAETEHHYQQQQQYMQLPLALPPTYDLVPESFPHRVTEPVRVRERSPPLPARFRDLYSSEWSGLNVHERMRGVNFNPVDRPERRSRESWSMERELQNRDLSRKRKLLDDAWRLEHSPDAVDHGVRRHGSSLERSPGGSSRDGGRYSDPERLPRSDRTSPARERQNSHNTSCADKRKKTQNLSETNAEKDRKRKASDSSKSPAKKEHRSENPALSSSLSKSVHQANPNGQKLSQVWQGVLLLKNSSFPTSLHLLEGDLRVATGLLLNGPTGGSVSQLKISQRLRLDQAKLDEVARRLKAASSSGSSVLLAVPGKSEDGEPQDTSNSMERPLKNLVSYLKQKEAAGIISLPVGGSRDKDQGGVLHAFPPCEFSQQFLDASAKAFAKSEEDYLVMVIIKGAS
uniref:RNA-binding protein 15 n=1 Tax=Nothobranchius kadleci TaxID=1051664 RepID=A0A1A8D211_NOTKA